MFLSAGFFPLKMIKETPLMRTVTNVTTEYLVQFLFANTQSKYFWWRKGKFSALLDLWRTMKSRFSHGGEERYRETLILQRNQQSCYRTRHTVPRTQLETRDGPEDLGVVPTPEFLVKIQEYFCTKLSVRDQRAIQDDDSAFARCEGRKTVSEHRELRTSFATRINHDQWINQ